MKKTLPCPTCGTDFQFSEKDIVEHCSNYCEFLNSANVEKEIAQADLLALKQWIDDPVLCNAVISAARAVTEEEKKMFAKEVMIQIEQKWERLENRK